MTMALYSWLLNLVGYLLTYFKKVQLSSLHVNQKWANMRLICTSERQNCFRSSLTKRSLYYAADTAMMYLGLEVDLFRQKLPTDTRTVARRYANRLHAVTLRHCHGVTGHGATIINHVCGRHSVVRVGVTTP